MLPKVITFPSAILLAEAAAAQLLKSIPEGAPFHLALSGGRISKLFYEAIVAKVRSTRQTIGHVHFFFADERCVPPDSPESNYLTARQSLFDPLHIRAEQIHRIRGEVEDVYAVKEAEAELCRIAPMDSAGQPVLDLVILGMGEDGHTASLFPGEPDSLVADASVYRAVTAVKPPPRRITLGYAPLRAARQLCLLASGSGKEWACRQLFAELKQDAPKLPIARVLHNHPNVLILSDIAEF